MDTTAWPIQTNYNMCLCHVTDQVFNTKFPKNQFSKIGPDPNYRRKETT
jgi:hypothetical protein